MIKSIFIFLYIFLAFFFGIIWLRSLTKKEKWSLTKNLAYSTLCAVLTMLTLLLIVVLF